VAGGGGEAGGRRAGGGGRAGGGVSKRYIDNLKEGNAGIIMGL